MAVDCRVEMGLELWDGLPGAGVVAFSSSADAGAYSLVLREILDPYYRSKQRGR